ncbi:MAG: metallophosphoesterase family protein [Paraclostridium sp.]
MKFIFITDTHGKASSPKSRLDDYPQAILDKMEYIGEFAKNIKATAVIHGGDWLDTPDVSESFVREFAKIVNNYPCAVYGVLGNHDIYGYNPETFLRTSLGVAEGMGLFDRLLMKNPYIVYDGETRVAITGRDSDFNLDKGPEKAFDYSRSYRIDNAINIHVVHGMLVEREWPQIPCTTIKEVMDDFPAADIILTGHEHTGFGVKEYYRPDSNSKVIFCNPGSLARVTAGTGDVRRDVRMAVITVEGSDFNVELVNLPSEIAKPASEVLDSDRLAQEKLNKQQLEGFIAHMNSIEVENSFNVFESLNELSRIEATDEDVLIECRKQLEIAQEELGLDE